MAQGFEGSSGHGLLGTECPNEAFRPGRGPDQEPLRSWRSLAGLQILLWVCGLTVNAPVSVHPARAPGWPAACPDAVLPWGLSV